MKLRRFTRDREETKKYLWGACLTACSGNDLGDNVEKKLDGHSNGWNVETGAENDAVNRWRKSGSLLAGPDLTPRGPWA